MAYTTTTPNVLNVRDALLKSADALPSAASTTVNGTGIDIGPTTGISSRTERSEFYLSVPALSTTILPDTKTMTINIQCDSVSTFGSATNFVTSAIVQTGASSTGAAAATYRMKLPSNGKRYWRAVAISGANTTDASALKMTFELTF